MKTEKRTVLINYEIIDNTENGTHEDQNLIRSAEIAAGNAYSPYSGFSVGAAVLMEGGQVITGSNQENAAYPNGLCAERVALFSAASNYPDRNILKIAVAAKNKSGNLTPVTPCGSCRQVLYEYEVKQHRKIIILLIGPDQTILRFDSADTLLPLGFNRFQLE
jgi:cytidine deaminase